MERTCVSDSESSAHGADDASEAAASWDWDLENANACVDADRTNHGDDRYDDSGSDSDGDSTFSWRENHTENSAAILADIEEKVSVLNGDAGIADVFNNPSVTPNCEEMLHVQYCDCDASGEWWRQHMEEWNLSIACQQC